MHHFNAILHRDLLGMFANLPNSWSREKSPLRSSLQLHKTCFTRVTTCILLLRHSEAVSATADLFPTSVQKPGFASVKAACSAHIQSGMGSHYIGRHLHVSPHRNRWKSSVKHPPPPGKNIERIDGISVDLYDQKTKKQHAATDQTRPS